MADISRLSVQKNRLFCFSLTMATINKNTITAMERPSKNKKFIPRVFIRKEMNRPSAEGAREYNELKREFNSLFSGFTSNPIKIAARRLSEKTAKLAKAARRTLQLRTTIPSLSYASTVVKGPHNPRPIVVKTVEETRHIVSRFWARRDYTKAYKAQEKERAAAHALCLAIAARHAKRVFIVHQKEQVDFVKYKELRVACRLARKIARYERKPKEVLAFPVGCGYEPFYADSVKTVSFIKPQQERGVVWPTSVKQRKVRAVIPEQETDRTGLKYPTEKPRWTRTLGQRLLAALLGKTENGRALLATYLQVKLARADKVEQAEEALRYFRKELREVLPQMDETAHGEEPQATTLPKSDVVLMEQTGKSTTIPVPPSNVMAKLSTAHLPLQYTTLSDRWLYLDTISWGPTDTKLKTYVLPKDIVLQNEEMSNVQLFKIHRFFRGTICVRFQMNSNKFQIGQLQANWFYGTRPQEYKHYDSIYSGSQRLHCLLNAGSSNVGELRIPYQHPYPYMVTKGRTGQQDYPLEMGILTLRVVNPLISTSSSYNRASITIYISFEDADYAGIVHRTIPGVWPEPQMDTVASLIPGGSEALSVARQMSSLLLDTHGLNRDNPPSTMAPPFFVPQAAQSFSATDGVVEPLHALRADLRGQVPSTSTKYEHDLTSLQKISGLIYTMEWKTSQKSGDQIERWDVHPMPLKYFLPTTTGLVDTTAYILPPIAVLSQMYGYWRGDIEYRFDVVASQFHTGRLLVGQVPFGSHDDLVPLSFLKSSGHQVFDLQEGQQFVYRAPYYANRPWWPQRYSITNGHNVEVQGPSMLYVYVLNPLIAMDSVPNKVYINVYISAADNFELAVPVPPSLALPWGPRIVQPTDVQSHFVPSYRPVFTTSNRFLADDQGNLYLTWYWKGISDDHTQMLNLRRDRIYKLGSALTTVQRRPWRSQYYKDNKLITLEYMCAAKQFTNVMVPVFFETLAAARKYHQLSDAAQALRLAPAIRYSASGPWDQWTLDGKNWVDCPRFSGDAFVDVKFDLVEGENNIYGQMDERYTYVQPAPSTAVQPVASTSSGVSTFGERTPDLKSLLRRWNIYTSLNIAPCIDKQPRDCPPSAIIHVHPCRVLKLAASNDFDNRVREGIVPIVASGFFGYRGSIRMRFVFSAFTEGTMVYIQHRFDENATFADESVESAPTVRTAKQLMDTQYATTVQSLGVNPIVTVEIPWYRMTEINYLQPYDRNVFPEAYSLGDLYVYAHAKVGRGFNMDVYISMGDDMEFRVFQGFPAMVYIHDLPPEPQMEDTWEIVGQMDESGTISEPQGPIATFSSAMAAPAKLNETMDKVQQVTDKASEFITATSERIQQVSVSFTDVVDKLKSKAPQMATSASESLKMLNIYDIVKTSATLSMQVISQIVHMVINPKKGTVIWSTVSMLVAVFNFSIDRANSIQQKLDHLYNKIYNSLNQPPQGQMDDEKEASYEAGSLASVLFAAITSCCGIVCKPPKSFADVTAGLFNFGFVARGAMNVGAFVKDNFILVRRLFRKVLGYFKTDDDAAKSIVKSKGLIKTWLCDTLTMLDPAIRNDVLSNVAYAQKVFELATVGRGLQVLLVQPSEVVPSDVRRTINDKQKELVKLEKELIDRKIYSVARYEPFCMWLSGVAGAGKTRYVEHISEIWAEAEKWQGKALAVRTAGNKYWDCVTNEPTVFLDDYVTVSPTLDMESYAQFLNMKSAAPFNPPYAQAEDKARYLNFRNIVVTSNFKEIANCPGIQNEEAYNRRRDLLIHFEFAPGMDKLKFKTQDLELIKAMNGIRLFYYPDPCQVSDEARREIVPEEGKTLRETLDTFVMEKYRDYHLGEAKSYEDRSKRILKRLESAMEGKGSLTSILVRGQNAYEEVIDEDCYVVKDGKMVAIKYKATNFLNDFLYRVKKAEQPHLEPFFTENKAKVMVEHSPRCAYPLPQNTPDSDYEDMDEEEIEEHEAVEKLYGNLFLGSIYRDNKDVIGQMDEKPSTSSTTEKWRHPTWDDDWIVRENIGYVGEDHVIEPVDRSTSIFQKWQSASCHHLLFDWKKAQYDSVDNLFYKVDNCTMQTELKSPVTVRAGPCLIRQGDAAVPMEGCLWDLKNKDLMFQYIEAVRTVAPDVIASATSCRTHEMAKLHFPQEWIDKLTFMRDPIQTELSVKLRKREYKIVDKAVQEIEKRYIVRNGKLFSAPLSRKTLWEKIIDGLMTIVLTLKIFILGVFTVLMGFALVRTFTGGIEEKPEPNVHASGDFHKMKHSRSMRVKARNLFGSDEAQGAIESSFIDSEEDYARVTAIKGDKDRQIIDKILRNAVYVVGMVPQPDGRLKTYKVRCLGLYERKVLFIRHYYEHFVANGVTRVGIISRYGNSDIRYDLDELKFEWTDGGYGVLSLPSSYPYSFLNVVKRFMPSEEKNFQYPARGLLVEFTFDDVFCWSVPLKLESSIDVKGVNAQQPWVIAKGFSYPWGGSGKCGSLLFAPTLGTPLIGVHTAGIGESKGYAELLLKETFIDAVEPNVVDYVVPQMEIREDTAVLGGEYQIVGTLDSDMMLHTPKETKIIESEIHGVFPVKTEPAPLSSSDPRLPKGCDPLYEGTSKRCDKIKEFIADDVQYAATDLRSVILQNAEPLRQVKPLSVLEAINGFPGLHGYEKIEMKTSEGYPWVKMRPKGYTDKSWMFQFDLDENGQKKVAGVCVDLHKTLETKARMRQLGLVPASYFSACLKDARILKEKVSTPGKTRVFEISPVDLTIAQRQLMLDFTAAYQNSRTKCENTIGINVNGPEWTDLATQLTSFSPFILTGDFSGFGPRLSLQCLEIVFDIISQWYIMHDSSRTEEQIYVEMESLKHEIVHGLHVFKNLVFRPTSGMPSGNAATVHLNSLVNSLYIRVAYLSIMRKARADLADLYYFHKLVRFFHNGDDIIMAVHPDIIEVFNNESLQKFFAQYDIKYTDATKSGEIRKYCTIEEATYLKSHFKRHPFRHGQWLAALAAESVGDCANWVWKSPNLRESSLLNSEQACRLAYGHGEIYYRFVCQTIRNAWEKHSVNFRAPLWKSLDAAVWDRVDGPLFMY